MERGIAAGLLAMEMGIDEILYGKVRVLGDGCLDLVMQWRERGVHHDDAIVTDHDEDVAAATSSGSAAWCQDDHGGLAAASSSVL
jgi:hypothetical protein